jgi:hypothetical protein
MDVRVSVCKCVGVGFESGRGRTLGGCGAPGLRSVLQVSVCIKMGLSELLWNLISIFYKFPTHTQCRPGMTEPIKD